MVHEKDSWLERHGLWLVVLFALIFTAFLTSFRPGEERRSLILSPAQPSVNDPSSPHTDAHTPDARAVDSH